MIHEGQIPGVRLFDVEQRVRHSRIEDFVPQARNIRDQATLVHMAGNVALSSEKKIALEGDNLGKSIAAVHKGSYHPTCDRVPHPSTMVAVAMYKWLIMLEVRDA